MMRTILYIFLYISVVVTSYWLRFFPESVKIKIFRNLFEIMTCLDILKLSGVKMFFQKFKAKLDLNNAW